MPSPNYPILCHEHVCKNGLILVSQARVQFILLVLLLLLAPACLHASDPDTSDPPSTPAPGLSGTASSPGTINAGGTIVDKSYRMYPGDLMKVEVFDHPDLTIQIHIPANGRITFPLIGDVENIIGRSVEDLNAELKRRLEDGYITTAIITISFLDFGPRDAYVMGSVRNPTSISLSPFAPTSAMQAISKAGGFSDGANRAAAHVVRNDPANPGRKIAIPLPAEDNPNSMGKDVILQPEDIIIIPRLDRIFILGQVKKPGALDLPGTEDLTVSKAISLAGGFERFGRQSEVQIIRGGKTMIIVDVKAVLSGAKAEDPTLKPGDTVFVPETRF